MSIEIDVDIRIQQDALPEEQLISLLTDVCRVLLAQAGCDEAEVSLLLVDDDEIHALNRTYRGIDASTDVLSFPLNEPEDEGAIGSDEYGLHLGDVVISWEHTVAQAREYGHSVEREMAFLTVHGLLHLLGYDHDEPQAQARMRAREEAALAELGLSR